MKTILPALLLLSLFASPAYAGGGHEHGPGGIHLGGGPETAGSQDVVVLDDQSISTLGIATAKAAKGRVPVSLSMYGTVRPDPRSSARVSAKFDGAVTKLSVLDGEEVRAGQEVLVAQPHQLGSQPVSVTASQEGVVAGLSLSQGQAFSARDPLFEIVDPGRLTIEAELPHGEGIRQVRVGQRALVTLPFENPQMLEGRVERISGALSEGGASSKVFISLPTSDPALRPNLRLLVDLVVKEGEEAVLVPAQALLGETTSQFVFVRYGNVFDRRPVSVGVRAAGQAAIVSGVTPESEVVTRGHYQLQFASSPFGAAHGPHEGRVAPFADESGVRAGFVELKLHDDKGDLELWLARDEGVTKPFDLPLETAPKVSFPVERKTVTLGVRNREKNEGEDGAPNNRGGQTNYFIFPGESGQDPRWLMGSTFHAPARVTFEANGRRFTSEEFLLVPHTHGAGEAGHEAPSGAGDHGHEHKADGSHAKGGHSHEGKDAHPHGEEGDGAMHAREGDHPHPHGKEEHSHDEDHGHSHGEGADDHGHSH